MTDTRESKSWFAPLLQRLTDEGGMTQSDAARKSIWGETTNNQDYKVAKNRARVSSWLSGGNTPNAEIDTRYGTSKHHPALQSTYDLDVSIVREAYEFLHGREQDD